MAAILTAMGAAGRAAGAGEAGTVQTYQSPPPAMEALVDAIPTPQVDLSPDLAWMLLLHRPGLPGIDEVAEPEVGLAGLRIHPRTGGPSRGPSYSGLTFRRLGDGVERAVTGLPEHPRLGDVRWSPDSRRVAFTVERDDRLELWCVDPEVAAARRVVDRPLNGAYGRPFQWMSDSQGWFALVVPEDHGPAPAVPRVPAGPVVQENLGRRAPAMTHQDLLASAHDEALFDHYTIARVVRVGLDGSTEPLGDPARIRRIDPSPDGRYLLVESVHPPYSYQLPEWAFPHRIEIWDREGRVVHLAADEPLKDEVPIGHDAVPTGPRDLSWRADADAELVWAEALDGGDSRAAAEARDRVLRLPAPFSAEPELLATLSQRFGGVYWSSDDLALISEWWWKTRNSKLWWVRPGRPATAPELLQDRSWEDRYHNPGRPVTRETERGTRVLVTTGDGLTVYLSGEGASPDGNRPFIDELRLPARETVRLFRSEAPWFEEPVAWIEPGRLLLTRRESRTDPPNYHLRDLAGGTTEQKSFFPDPLPQLAGIQRVLIRYARADGVQLTGTLYLPAGYAPERDGPLPALLWAYPQEFKSADAAGQVTDSPCRFARPSALSPVAWLVQGFAVLDDPAMPIVGEGDAEPNDTYVEQLVASARAAVEELARRGVGDPARMAIGGHSYGAFMTANLLAHSDLFRAGIARSGAYNRTLTPFGFQSEERTLWEAPETYLAMSPFMLADRIDEPLLMIHGQADSNSGTFPLQSERLYAALAGLGGTVRLVLLPHESHGYRARESVKHVLWETWNWLDRYVRQAPPRD